MMWYKITCEGKIMYTNKDDNQHIQG